MALCDVNENNLQKAAQQFPGAKTYVDWRKCLDQKDIDAVVCSTTDHTHAFISIWAMNHVAAVSMPLAGGFLWKYIGYQWAFGLGAVAAALSVVAATFVPRHAKAAQG